MSEEKMRFAFYWAASCGGCEIAVLDIDEKILDVVEHADILFWPVALDTKYKDVEEMEDNYIDVCFFNGAIRTSEQEEIAELLRERSKFLIAFGACSCHGGIPGLANMADKEEIFDAAYKNNPSVDNQEGKVPKTEVQVEEGKLTLPEFYDTVQSLDQVVDVDYYMPGCPPPTEVILNGVTAIFEGKIPEKGAVLAPEKTVCDECEYEKSEKKIKEVKRILDVKEVEDKCLLEQGLICMGPATRGGCEARCLDANMACTGCGGEPPNSMDQGAKMISALASILGIEGEEDMTEEEVDELIDQVVDITGTFYKYSLPVSLLKRKVMER